MAFSANLLKIAEQLASVKQADEASPYDEMPELKVLIEYEKRITEILKQNGFGRIGWIFQFQVL